MFKAGCLSNKLLCCLVLLSSLCFIDQTRAAADNEQAKKQNTAKLNDVLQAIAQQENNQKKDILAPENLVQQTNLLK